MNYAVVPPAGDDVIAGTVMPPGDDAPPETPARPRPAPHPGALRVIWRHYGPFIRPCGWLSGVWLNGAAVQAVVPLPVKFLLAVAPAAITGYRKLFETRERKRCL